MAFVWVHELSRTAGSPATGNTPLFFYDTMGSTTLRHYGFTDNIYYPTTHSNDPAWYYDTAGPTPTTMSNASGTGTRSSPTPRTHHRRLIRRCSGQLQRHPGGQHDAERSPLHRSSGALHRHPAPPGAVHLKPRVLQYVTDNADSIIIHNLSTGHRAHLPHTTDAPEQDNHGRKRCRTTVISGNSSTA